MNTNTTTLKTETIRDFPEVRAHLARLHSLAQERLQGGSGLNPLEQSILHKKLDVASRRGAWKAHHTRTAPPAAAPIVKCQVEEVLFPFWSEVLEGFRAAGEGWQTRINTVLRTALAEGKI